MSDRLALLEPLIERFPTVPREAVLKEDLLRTGIAFADEALSDNLEGAVKPKSYFIFSFDQRLKQGEAIAHAVTGSSWTKRSSGMRSSSPASCAISRNVYRPARSRGPKR